VSTSADGAVLAVGASDGGVHVVPLPTGEISILRAKGPGARVALSPDGAVVAAGAASGGVALFDRKGASLGAVALDGPVLSLAFSRDGARLAIGAHDARVHLVDGHTGAPQRDLELDAGDVVSLAFSPGAGKLLTASASGLTLWELTAGRGEHYPGFGLSARAVAWVPDSAVDLRQAAGGERAAFAVARGDASIAFGAPGKPAPTAVTHLLGSAVDVAYAAGALAVAEQDGSVTLRTPEGRIVTRLRVPGAAARALAPLPAGVAAAMSDGALRVFLAQKQREVVALWPVAKGAVAETPDGHVELLGEARHTVFCRLGPVAYPWEVCAEPFKVEGLVAVAISGRDPGEADL
jgi:dipeptidyl aminopeptidase/acylaminoacyl peptidase